MMPDFVGVSDDAGSIGTSTSRSQQRFITVDQCTLDLWQQKAHELYQRCGQHHKADCFMRSYIVNQFTNIPPAKRKAYHLSAATYLTCKPNKFPSQSVVESTRKVVT